VIKVKKLHPLAQIPKRANSTDAGADLYSIEDLWIPPLGRMLVRTGLSLDIPDGVYGRIAPRSGLALKHGVDVLAGVIDPGYRGEIGVVLYNTDQNSTFKILRGDRIAQIIFEQYYLFSFIESQDDLNDSNRSMNGFGSSGTN
jgi:dUTP pyrophosphatase